MMPHAVLSRRGAFGLAALLSFVRPAPAAESRGYAQGVVGEVLELRSFGEGICLDAQGLNGVQAEMLHCVRTGAVITSAPDAADGVPWGWDTLENVR